MIKTSETQSQTEQPPATSKKTSQKSILALSVFALGLNATAAAYTMLPSDFAWPNVSGLVAELLPHEQARLNAMISGERATLDMLLHERLIYIHTQGQRHDKPAFLATIESGLVQYEELHIEVHSAVPLGSEAWLLSGRLKAVAAFKKSRGHIDVVFTSTWVRDALRWRMSSWQSTGWPAEQN